MATISIKGVYKVTADPAVVNDIEKLVVDFDFNGIQRRVAIPWQDFSSLAEFKNVMRTAIQNVKPRKRVINLTRQWKGDYTV